MGNYIEKDFKIYRAEEIIKEKLLKSGANEASNGAIVKSGFLNSKIKGIFDTSYDYCFSFKDTAGESHAIFTEDRERVNDTESRVQIKIGYEIIFIVPTRFFIKIHTPAETFKTLSINVPEEILFLENPWEEFVKFVDNKLNIVKNNIELGKNSWINDSLK